MILLNLFFESGKANLVFRTESGRKIFSEHYRPYFYVLCDEPEERCWQFSQHPLVISATLEEKYPAVESRRKEQTVKVTTTMEDFKRVASDMRKVQGVRELAETAVPHHFRYIADKGMEFFAHYNERLEKVESDVLPDLRLASMSKEDRIPQGADVVFTYGGDHFLKGRPGVISTPIGCFLKDVIHLDLHGDMAHDIYNESTATDMMELGKERLVRVMELSMISGAKPDLASRISPGKLNTYLHMEAAKRNGYLIPDTKKPVERPKSLRMLSMADKGGTIFYPRPGLYRDVAKCDFASLYPSIIVKCNISPETMHCECPDYIEVPKIGWRICKRKGLIPQGLEKVLKRRLALKTLMKNSTGEKRKVCDIRQRALKNILVCAYGYLGYSNFVFSNVENKESVVLFGQHMLERTNMIAEDCGLEVIYGIVDSVFVKNGTPERYREFVRRVSQEFSIELELDCLFRTLAFPSSRDRCGAANKYYGITYEGKIESRGIALRHSDAPLWIKEFEERAVRAILNEDLTGLDEIYSSYLSDIMENRVPLEKLAITKSVRKESYKVKAAHVAAYKLAPNGLGSVIYVHTPDGPKPLELADRADPRSYRHLLEMSMEELLRGVISPNSSSASFRAQRRLGRSRGGILPGC